MCTSGLSPSPRFLLSMRLLPNGRILCEPAHEQGTGIDLPGFGSLSCTKIMEFIFTSLLSEGMTLTLSDDCGQSVTVEVDCMFCGSLPEIMGAMLPST